MDVMQSELADSIGHKNMIDDAYMSAVDAGARYMASNEREHYDANELTDIAGQFFNTLSAALGILDNPYQQEMLNLYIPVMAVIDDAGFYVSYNHERTESGVTRVSKAWTELMPYGYEDEDFVYRLTLGDDVYVLDKGKAINPNEGLYHMNYKEMGALIGNKANNVFIDGEGYGLLKRRRIMSIIEESLTYYVNLNNDIAAHYGITYQFNLPDMDESQWSRSIIGTSLVVVFQGYPYNDGNDHYNQFTVSGAYIRHAESYYVMPEGYYYLYHKEGCVKLSQANGARTLYSPLECAKEGAFACALCN